MNLSFFLRLAACRTRSSACDTLSRHCVRRVLCWPAFPLAPALGSTGSAAVAPALFVGFPATMAESDFSRPCIIGYGSSPSRCGPAVSSRRSIPRPPGSRTRSVRTCQGLRPRRVGRTLAMTRPSVLPSAKLTSSAPRISIFRGSMAGLCAPLSTLRRDPRGCHAHDSGPMRIATPSSQGTCTPYSLPVSRRTNIQDICNGHAPVDTPLFSLRRVIITSHAHDWPHWLPQRYDLPEDHPPPHFHVFGSEFSAKFAITNCGLLSSKGRIRRRDIRAVEEWGQ